MLGSQAALAVSHADPLYPGIEKLANGEFLPDEDCNSSNTDAAFLPLLGSEKVPHVQGPFDMAVSL